MSREAMNRVSWPGVIRQYRDRLPADAGTSVITLGEGATPLLPAPVVSARTGCEVYLKVEGANPTGSFKDRGMTVAVRSEEHTSELQSQSNLVCRLLLEKKK